MSDLVWEDPPAPIKGSAKWHRYADVAESLKAKPGQWARVGEFTQPSQAGGLSSRIKSGRDAFCPRGSFESTMRTIKSDRAGQRIIRVYARYVGDISPSS